MVVPAGLVWGPECRLAAFATSVMAAVSLPCLLSWQLWRRSWTAVAPGARVLWSASMLAGKVLADRSGDSDADGGGHADGPTPSAVVKHGVYCNMINMTNMINMGPIWNQ